jgi:regulator of sirC expression with transglutaminase-like and TPR domain
MDTPLGLFLQPSPPRDILTRMLRNLKEIFSSQEDWPRLLNVLDRLIVLNHDSYFEWRDRGLALMELGQNDRARQDLMYYLNQMPNAADAVDIKKRLALLEQ